MKKLKIFLIVSFGIFILAILLYLLVFSKYTVQQAIWNKDVVLGTEIVNFDKFKKFTDDISNDTPSKVRLAVFSKEGRPTLFELEYKDSKIICITDQRYAYPFEYQKKETKTYSNIGFVSTLSQVNCILSDEETKDEQYLFQISANFYNSEYME